MAELQKVFFFFAPLTLLDCSCVTFRDPLRLQKWHWWHMKRLIL
jgi:hypothetical protein